MQAVLPLGENWAVTEPPSCHQMDLNSRHVEAGTPLGRLSGRKQLGACPAGKALVPGPAPPPSWDPDACQQGHLWVLSSCWHVTVADMHLTEDSQQAESPMDRAAHSKSRLTQAWAVIFTMRASDSELSRGLHREGTWIS